MKKARSPKLLIFLTIFIDLLGFGIIIPIITFIADDYLPDATVGRHVLIGASMACYSIMQMIFSPILGRISDRIGRRPVILLSLAGSSASYLLFGLANNFALILISRTLAGVCAANISTAQAYIADVTDEKDRTAGMGLIGMAFGLGFALGPVFGGVATWIGEIWSPDLPSQTYPGLLASAICLINFLWAIKGLPESLPVEKRAQVEPYRRFAPIRQVFASIGHPTIGPLIGVFFFATFAFSNMEMAFGLFAKKTSTLQMTSQGIYGVFIFIGLILTLMHGLAGRVAKVVPQAVMVIVGTLLQAVGLMIMPAIPNLTCMLIGMAVLSIGQGLCVPALLALVSLAAGPTEKGRVLGITQSVSSMARIFGPLFSGFVIMAGEKMTGRDAYGWPFWSGAFVMLIAVWMAVITRRRIGETGPAISDEAGDAPGAAG